VVAEVKAARPDLNVEGLGVNWPGLDTYNGLIAAFSRLAWLQDTAAESVWTRWGVAPRDVRIADGGNQLVGTFNLDVHDLSNATNRAALKLLLLDAARGVDTDRDGLPDDWEMQFFGSLAPGPGGDPDGDGRTNFDEYVFGSDPNSARDMPRPAVTVTDPARPVSGIHLELRRRAGDWVRYTFEVGDELGVWRPAGIEFQAEPPGKVVEFDGRGTARDFHVLWRSLPVKPRGFVRVRAEVREGGGGGP
jgi:hypothetical protein